MGKRLGVIVGLGWLLLLGQEGLADSTWEYAVQLRATVQDAPPQISLSWPQDSCQMPTNYLVYRKAPGAGSWGKALRLPGWMTNYTDRTITPGIAYEYQVVKLAAAHVGYGYLYAGLKVPLTEERGRVLLVVDRTYAGDLTNELTRLQLDLVGDGWSVTRLDVSRHESPSYVKSLIKAEYQADPAQVKSVFLLGHVPVAYSGDIVPDGHAPDHQGAWPCDGFYGDMDGWWTDSVVNNSSAADPRTHNVPGDGKFDQSMFPAPIKLMVGRVDLADMPGRLCRGGAPTFPSELELLRNYLNKDHRFRQKEFDLPRRAVLGDYFGLRDGEAFAASGWRNLSSFFGSSGLTNLTHMGSWVSTLRVTPALCAYGCGAGSFTSIAGLGNCNKYFDALTTQIVSNDVKAAFVLLFGSWLGDWDSEDNVLRSVLALPSYGLASAWSGRPHWFLQHMALGEPIGFGARLTQNNGPGGLYQSQVNSAAGQIHIALMGDPTLRLHTVAPPSHLEGLSNNLDRTLRWTASADPVIGYHVYSASNLNGPFKRLTASPILTTNYTVNAPFASVYMVSAINLETSASGTYFNASQGAFLAPEGEGIDTRVFARSTVPAGDGRANFRALVSPVARPVSAVSPAGIINAEFRL